MRLLDRMRTGQQSEPAVWVGKIDQTEIKRITDGRTRLSAEQSLRVNELLNLSQPLADRLRFILDGPLADSPHIFVFDDFEINLEPDGNGGHLCTPEALTILSAFATAIRNTASPSRVIVTSRYDFPLPAGFGAFHQPLAPLHGADLDKKLRQTDNLGPGGKLGVDARQAVVEASGGIPRLIEWLDTLVSDANVDHVTLSNTIAAAQVEYREHILAEELLAMQRPMTRRVLAHAAIYNIPVPHAAVAALLPDLSVDEGLRSAVEVGLIDVGAHPSTQELHYLVSPLIKPLLESCAEGPDDIERLEAIRRGARFLYTEWVSGGE